MPRDGEAEHEEKEREEDEDDSDPLRSEGASRPSANRKLPDESRGT